MSKKNLTDIEKDRNKLFPKNNEEIAYIVDGSGPNGQFVPGIDDLQVSVKKTLSDYLSCLTSEGQSTYQIDDRNEEFSISDQNGFPADIVTGGSNSQKFTSNLENWVSSFLDNRAKDNSKTSDYLSKGRPTEKGAESGHTLLTSIDGIDVLQAGNVTIESSDGKTKIEKQISQVLKSNRFNPSPGKSPRIKSDDNAKTIDNVAIGKFRTTLGVYETTNETSRDITWEKLKKVGTSLQLMATGDDGSSNPDNSTGLFLGAGVQLGVERLSKPEMSIANAFNSRGEHKVTLGSDFPQNDGDPEYYSYGQLNNVNTPFGGFIPLGMIVLGSAMTTTMIVGSEIIFGLLALIVNTDGKRIRMDPGPYPFGDYGRVSADGLLSSLIGAKALGLIQTENDYFDAAKRGANVFFGFTGESLTGAAADALKNLIESPGYYVVVVRSILRSLNTISNAIADIDFSNPIAGAQAILGIVDVIKSSKIVAFFNACAALGDILINEEAQGIGGSGGDLSSVVSTMDNISDFPSTVNAVPGVVQLPGVAVQKSRSRTGTSALSLAWRSSAAPAMYILPTKVLNAGADFGPNASVSKGALVNYHADKFRVSTTNRLTVEEVKAMEDALESEYVPFYFHDLRTNEIVSVHAFLKSLTDNFTANYESVDGYGRIDAVKIYKNTQRAIEFSFILAATSEDDFDEMWWKINKLTTLLYPQWGQSRVIKNADGTIFSQPFSEIPTSSPMIRLRIGDVIKTNFSRFNLARLFGLGDSKTFNPGNGYIPANLNDSTYESIIRIVKDMSLDPDVTGNFLNGYFAGQQAILRPTMGGFYVEATTVGTGLLAEAAAIISTGSARRKIKLTTETPVKIVARETKNIDKNNIFVKSDNVTKTIYTVEFLDPELKKSLSGVTSVEVTHADLKIDSNYLDFVSNASGDASTAVLDFLSSINNPIMKSFESVSGRGLAGVIQSMNFDWFTPTWETSKPGKKAPKWCEISISFAPIHDIPPGLDDQGFNRAPVYNVGGVVNPMVGDVYDDSREIFESKARQEALDTIVKLSRIGK